MTNLSNAYLSQLERGLHEPSLRVLRALADALGMPLETLLAHTGLPDGGASTAAAAAATEAAIRATRRSPTRRRRRYWPCTAATSPRGATVRSRDTRPRLMPTAGRRGRAANC